MKSNLNYNSVDNTNDMIFYFSKGIYGFEEHHQFEFINQTDDVNNPFRLMVSLKNPKISFIVVPPTYIHDSYEIKINDLDLLELGVKDQNDVFVLGIVSIPQEKNCLYVNLKSPIALSMSSKRGKQIILENDNYSIRHTVQLKD